MDRFDIDDLLQCDRLKGVAVHFPDAADVPQPYLSLLAHRRDMTSTLSEFHGGEVELTVFETVHQGDAYFREVLLNVNGKPVEYGMIRMYLENFPADLREEVIAAKKPLGAILNDSGLEYVSKPRGLVEFPDAGFTEEFFPSAGGKSLFGRYNALLDEDGRFLARILEILPRYNP